MALIQCKECKNEISSKADFCPSCGFKKKQRSFVGSLFRYFVIYPTVVGVLAAVAIPSYSGFKDRVNLNENNKTKTQKKKYTKKYKKKNRLKYKKKRARRVKTNTVTAAYIGCISDKYLDEVIGASVKNNIEYMKYLLNQRVCFYLKGAKFNIIDEGITTSKALFYLNGWKKVLFVPSEAVR